MALPVCLILLLSACTSGEKTPDPQSSGSDTLTWTRWNGFDNFLELASRTYPEIKWEYTAYAGANRTGYSWAQMRSDDIPDIFISSQIIDEDLAKERLVDLANYDFINGLSTALLDQAAIDGGIYALPVNNVMYGICYNKTLMEEHGWRPAAPLTAAAFAALMKASSHRLKCSAAMRPLPFPAGTRASSS